MAPKTTAEAAEEEKCLLCGRCCNAEEGKRALLHYRAMYNTAHPQHIAQRLTPTTTLRSRLSLSAETRSSPQTPDPKSGPSPHQSQTHRIGDSTWQEGRLTSTQNIVKNMYADQSSAGSPTDVPHRAVVPNQSEQSHFSLRRTHSHTCGVWTTKRRKRPTTGQRHTSHSPKTARSGRAFPWPTGTGTVPTNEHWSDRSAHSEEQHTKNIPSAILPAS